MKIKDLLKKKISNRYLFYSIIIISLIYFVTNMFLTYFKIQKYPYIDTPGTFLKNFDEQGEKTEIGLRCDAWQLICFDSHFVSPLFPHSALKFYERTLRQTAPGVRKSLTLRYDPIWNVFWIQDAGTNWLFGPFRSDFSYTRP